MVAKMVHGNRSDNHCNCMVRYTAVCTGTRAVLLLANTLLLSPSRTHTHAHMHAHMHTHMQTHACTHAHTDTHTCAVSYTHLTLPTIVGV